MKKLFVTIGNGFSIELIDKLKLQEKINLKNLFAQGDTVNWPNAKKGFLSYKYCRNLWTLGARSYLSNEESHLIIDNIITCYNVFNYAQTSNTTAHSTEETNLFISAYNELSTYLIHLFKHYNSLVSEDALKEEVDDVSLVKHLKLVIDEYEEVNIITYNYDIFLERLLEIAGLSYTIAGFDQNPNGKINIFKPHGSISFSTKEKNHETKKFEIKRSRFGLGQKLRDYEVVDSRMKDLSLAYAIIPPFGDSQRTGPGWASELRELLRAKLIQSSSKDELIIYGISYGHVDRMEIDSVITSLHADVNVQYINPFPSNTLDMVLSSIFKNYIHLQNSKSLLGGEQ